MVIAAMIRMAALSRAVANATCRESSAICIILRLSSRLNSVSFFDASAISRLVLLSLWATMLKTFRRCE